MKNAYLKIIHVSRMLVPSMLLLVLLMVSLPSHAGDVKIIINGGGHHFNSGHNFHSNSDRLHNYNRFSKRRHSNRHFIGYRDPYYGKRHYRQDYSNSSYGSSYGRSSYGYGGSYRYNDRRGYRNRGSYCPY